MRIERELIRYKSDEEWLELRKRDITSTELAALFDLSPYMSRYELWHRKANPALSVPLEETKRMKAGRKLESAIAEIFAEQYGWIIEPFKVYMRLPKYRIGSSFDYKIISPFTGLLELKNVDWKEFFDKWTKDEENIEAPLHIEFQCQGELMVSGEEKLILGAWIGGNRDEKFERLPDYRVWDASLAAADSFWDSVDKGIAPEPDFKRDASFIKSLYQSVSPEKTIQATERIEELAKRYKVAAEQAKSAEEEKDAFKAEILTLIGDAEKVKGEGFSISANLVGPCPISYTREGYRNMRINWKKEKTNA